MTRSILLLTVCMLTNVSWAQGMQSGLALPEPQAGSYPTTLAVGPATENNAIIARWQAELPADVAAFERSHASGFDDLLAHVGDYFEGRDFGGPTGTVQDVHLMGGKAADRLRPFVAFPQDLDEVDAHVRWGVGAGLTYHLNPVSAIDAEVLYLQSSGDANPALGDETRFVLVFTTQF